MRDLQAFVRRLERDRSAAGRALDDERDAARASIDLETWRAARAGQLDVALLRALHRAVTADHEVARRARPDGAWILGPASPGQLRTKPQAVRLRDHVEPAWQPGALKGGLARLLGEASTTLADDPVAHAAHLLWSLSRAQPFIAGNERVALTVVARNLRGEGLPGLPVEDIERDPAFIDALIAATAGDRTALEGHVATAIWDAAVAWAEWLGAPAPVDPARWTLQAEHLALAEARRGASRIAAVELDGFVAHAAEAVRPAMAARLGTGLGPVERFVPADHAQRLAVAVAGAQRGRRICPHEPIEVLRWAVEGGHGVEVSLVAGAAGRGVSGAVSLHLALAPRDAIGVGVAPAFLVIADEPAQARGARFDRWLPAAIAQLTDRGALRV